MTTQDYHCLSFVSTRFGVSLVCSLLLLHNTVARVCVFVASKVEEEKRRVLDVFNVFHHMWQRRRNLHPQMFDIQTQVWVWLRLFDTTWQQQQLIHSRTLSHLSLSLCLSFDSWLWSGEKT